MKKSIIFYVFLLVSIFIVKAQFYESPFYMSPSTKSDVLDLAFIKITYKLTYVKNTEHPDVKDSDVEVLLIGKNYSKYYSSQYEDYNKEIFKGSYYDGIPNPPSGTLGMEIIKNNLENKLIYTELKTHPFEQNFMYKEEIPRMNWQISAEKKTIASYTCTKATTTFRGRRYEAWFSPEIPIPNGPWKFSGLPGLILSIADSKNEYHFECIGIENLIKQKPIVLYKLKYENTTHDKFLRYCQQYHNDVVPYAKAAGGASFNAKSMTDVSVDQEYKSLKQPFNSIEQE